jgi:hypothetical protein
VLTLIITRLSRCTCKFELKMTTRVATFTGVVTCFCQCLLCTANIEITVFFIHVCCTVYLSIISKQRVELFSCTVLATWKGLTMFAHDWENCPGFFTPSHIHTQNPNTADVTIQLFAKSGMQWQTNSRAFHWNTNVNSILLPSRTL